MDRAEKLKKHIEALKNDGKYREQIQIEENSIGHSYEKLFGRFLDSQVTTVQVNNSTFLHILVLFPYLHRLKTQVKSFLFYL